MKLTKLLTKADTLLKLFVFLCLCLVNFHCAKTVQEFKIPEKEITLEATRIYVLRPSFYGIAVTANIYENNRPARKDLLYQVTTETVEF